MVRQTTGGMALHRSKEQAIDVVRKEKRIQHHHEKFNACLNPSDLGSTVNQFFLENEIEDSQLRMMFACCLHLLTMNLRLHYG